MLLKKCRFCDRRFTKEEHLKRHQRSHTGEKPYQCPQCPKRFSRSDVLNRHQKAHTQPETTLNDIPGHHAPNSAEFSPNGTQQKEDQLQHWSLTGSTQAARTTPHDAYVAYTDHHGNDTEPAGQGPLWTVRDSLNYANQNENTQNTIFSECSRTNVTQPLHNLSSYSEHGDSIASRSHIDANQMFLPDRQWSPNGPLTMSDELHVWFDQFDSPQAETSQVMDDASLGSTFDTHLTHTQRAIRTRTMSGSADSVDSAVPNERFTKVEQCWPHKSGGRARAMHTLWQDMCSMSTDAVHEVFTNRDSHRRGRSSGWHLDEESRTRMEEIFGRVCSPEQTVSTIGQRDATLDINNNRRRSEMQQNKTKFPPAEVLDMSLDIYFRHFHHLVPFVHIPTFTPKTADVCLLFSMCLIGLNMINTRGATAFVQKSFNVILELVESQLSSYALLSETSTTQMLAIMASGVLLISLAEVLEDNVDHTKCHRMYIQLITLAQEHRLFAAHEGISLNEDTFAIIPDLSDRWKAWSRVESIKRLILSILSIDAWTATTHSACPIIRTDNIQLLLPCDAPLFQAPSASKWVDLLNQGHRICMPSVDLSAHDATIPNITKSADAIGIDGILCTIRLRILEDYYRLLPQKGSQSPEYNFVPWHIFATDPQTKLTWVLVMNVINSYQDDLGAVNPNSMAHWHNLCIMLTADLRIFEMGAGCMGPIMARKALENIAIWTQTTAARRSILHAAQTFKLVSNRRVSDGDPLHSSYRLFCAALILSLYVFMAPPQLEEEDGSTFELMDDVDWISIGSEGIAPIMHNHTDDTAVKFIRSGGNYSISGVFHSHGYQSARRILLDFVHLLDEVGKWRVDRFTRVLRIMSDALVEEEQ